MHQIVPKAGWFKSSYSGSQGDCVEVAHTPTSFHKSSYSSGANNCVEVSEGSTTSVRDTQNRDQGTLAFGPGEWRAFLSTAEADLG
ncbi:DUF397 domain-containing protein [Nocardiopsis sp. NPDC058631]|uniref:DUF397 domain-containing protein n=1 Tax=Nocardiopsis sp. NPDC058631 TaxID=3346566 RepID=UPI003660E2AA